MTVTHVKDMPAKNGKKGSHADCVRRYVRKHPKEQGVKEIIVGVKKEFNLTVKNSTVYQELWRIKNQSRVDAVQKKLGKEPIQGEKLRFGHLRAPSGKAGRPNNFAIQEFLGDEIVAVAKVIKMVGGVRRLNDIAELITEITFES